MPKKHIFIIIILLLILLALIFVYAKVSVAPTEESTKENNQEQIAQNEKVTLIIDFGEGDSQEIQADFKSGLTALDALKTGLQSLEIGWSIKESSAGAYIESIGNSQGGKDGKYWMSYLNGTLAPTSAEKTILKAGDRIEWKFEKPTF